MPTVRKIEVDKTGPHQVKFSICGLAPNLNKENGIQWVVVALFVLSRVSLSQRAWLTVYSKTLIKFWLKCLNLAPLTT